MRNRPGETLMPRGSAERFFQRYSKSGSQKLSGAACGNHHVVLTSQAKITRKINPWLIRKRHARLEDGLASAHEVGVLVAVKADSMPQPVCERLVVRPEPGIGDDSSRSVIDAAGEVAGARRVQGRVLRFSNDFKNARYSFRRFA